MFGLNPYALIGGGVAIALAGAAFFYQGHEIHKYHTQYDCVNSGQTCPKNFKGDTLPGLRVQIENMTAAQNNQTNATEKVVTKVVQAPAQVVTKTVVKEIHDTPVQAGCKAPEFPQDVKDSY